MAPEDVQSIQHATDTQAINALTRFGAHAIQLARQNGFVDDPAMTPEQRAHAILKAGVPLAMGDPKFASLFM